MLPRKKEWKRERNTSERRMADGILFVGGALASFVSKAASLALVPKTLGPFAFPLSLSLSIRMCLCREIPRCGENELERGRQRERERERERARE
jgi:hypothetical protein